METNKLTPIRLFISKIVLLLLSLLIGCSKDDRNSGSQTPDVKIYKGKPYQETGLQASIYDPETDFTTYTYGSFNVDGNPHKVTSIVLENLRSDTLYNYLVDENNRIYMSYASLKNGKNLKRVVELSFVDDENALMGFYDYNWEDNTSVLIQQLAVDYENETAKFVFAQFSESYGDLEEFQGATAEIKSFLRRNMRVIGAVAIIGTAIATCGGSAGLACGPALLAVSTAVGLLNAATTNASTLSTSVPKHPSNPANNLIPSIVNKSLIGTWTASNISLTFNANKTFYLRQGIYTNSGTYSIIGNRLKLNDPNDASLIRDYEFFVQDNTLTLIFKDGGTIRVTLKRT